MEFEVGGVVECLLIDGLLLWVGVLKMGDDGLILGIVVLVGVIVLCGMLLLIVNGYCVLDCKCVFILLMSCNNVVVMYYMVVGMFVELVVYEVIGKVELFMYYLIMECGN